MANTYIIIEDGIVINRILADNIFLAKRTTTEDKVVVQDNDNNFMIGDTYTE